LHFKPEPQESSQSSAGYHGKNKHQKAQYALSKAYYDKFGFKMMSSSSSSANGGSGSHSSDDQQHDSISLLKKRNFRDFQKQCTVSSSLEGQGSGLCDEMKLLKQWELERKKKAKLSHTGLLVSGPPSGHHFYGSRSGSVQNSLKRKRKVAGDLLPSELK